MARSHWRRSRGRYFVAVDFDATVDETLVGLLVQTPIQTKTRSNNTNVTLFMGRFSPWAVLDLAMGRFGHIENLWAVLVGAVLVHGPFWYRPI